MSDIVERLRSLEVFISDGVGSPVAFEAADTIAALRAENERLRGALRICSAPLDTFAIGRVGEDDQDIVVDGSSRFAHERDVVPRLMAARAALGEKGE